LVNAIHTDIITDRTLNGSHSVEVVVDANTQLAYSIDQNLQHADGTISHRFICKQDSQLTVSIVATGGNQVANTIEVILMGSGAQAYITGGYVGTATQQHAIKITQEHCAPHTTSYSNLKGAIADHAQVRYHGMINIAQGAHGANAALYNKNLLLSHNARAFSVPGLQVKTHEVQCKHGTATGRFDDDQVLYMQSRGLLVPQAEQLLLRGFFTDGLRLTDEQLSGIIAKLI